MTMQLNLSDIKQAVQKNCHIADANHAGDFTLCVYLLKMREFYRWEHGYNYGDTLPNEGVGNWLRHREELWETLQDESFNPLIIAGQSFDPFHSREINSTLLPQHLVYSGGYGYNLKPHFFLGVLEHHESHEDYDIYVAGDEYACDLASPPAMSQGKQIFLRRDALRRMLWEKYEQWLWNKPDNAMGRALSFYDFQHNLDNALDDMTQTELQSALWHEIGEVRAHHQLGSVWEQILIDLPHSKLEIQLRAIRDLYADMLVTLPKILEHDNDAALHFFLANLTNMRRHLFPALVNAYDVWTRSGDRGPLHSISEQGLSHWGKLCQDVVDYKLQHPDNFQAPLSELIENSKL